MRRGSVGVPGHQVGARRLIEEVKRGHPGGAECCSVRAALLRNCEQLVYVREHGGLSESDIDEPLRFPFTGDVRGAEVDHRGLHGGAELDDEGERFMASLLAANWDPEFIGDNPGLDLRRAGSCTLRSRVGSTSVRDSTSPVGGVGDSAEMHRTVLGQSSAAGAGLRRASAPGMGRSRAHPGLARGALAGFSVSASLPSAGCGTTRPVIPGGSGRRHPGGVVRRPPPLHAVLRRFPLVRPVAATAFDGPPPAHRGHGGVGAPYAQVTATLRRLVDPFRYLDLPRWPRVSSPSPGCAPRCRS